MLAGPDKEGGRDTPVDVRIGRNYVFHKRCPKYITLLAVWKARNLSTSHQSSEPLGIIQ
jgi:hypothetical protein